jgi:outer membrane protein
MSYDMSFGTGNLGDFISAPSFRGASAQYRYGVTDNILVGFDAGWNVFFERKDYETYSSGTISLSGIQYRYQNEIPLYLSADYILTTDNIIKPYVGLGIGTIYCDRVTDMGIWRLEENPWQFAIKPELGLLYELSEGTALQLAVKYNYGFKTEELDSQGYLTISAGFAFGW